MRSFILGTAGHIDHGKTTLVKYLTGKNTDTLLEEQQRGMTIDIGYSYLSFNYGQFGIIDVPGHEKFIKNMLAGATSINYILFAIACDDGIMPQTIEHFNILNFLGIKNGVIVLTKTDRVSQEGVSFLKVSINNLVKDTPMKNFKILETSTKDLESLKFLKNFIERDIKKLLSENSLEKNIFPDSRDKNNINLFSQATQNSCVDISSSKEEFLMYIDRSFHMKGQGSIVTGSISSGEINLQDEVYLYPSKIKSKIKSMETHGEKIDSLYKNNRLALNLSSLSLNELKRGSFLSSNNNLVPSTIIDIIFSPIKNLKFKNFSEYRFYIGTTSFVGRIKILASENNLYYAQLILSKEIFSFPNQLGICRNLSLTKTIGGIKIISPHGEKISYNSPDFSKYVERLKNLNSNKSQDSLSKEILLYIENFHKEFPLEKGVSLKKLKDIFLNKINFPSKKILKNNDSSLEFDKIISDFLLNNTLKKQGSYISIFNFKIKLTKQEKEIKEKIFKFYKKSSFLPVKYEIIESELNLSSCDKNTFFSVHSYMVREEMIVYLEDSYYMLGGFFKELQKNILSYFESNFSLGEFREKFNLERKIAIILLRKLEKINFLKNINNVRYINERRHND